MLGMVLKRDVIVKTLALPSVSIQKSREIGNSVQCVFS